MKQKPRTRDKNRVALFLFDATLDEWMNERGQGPVVCCKECNFLVAAAQKLDSDQTVRLDILRLREKIIFLSLQEVFFITTRTALVRAHSEPFYLKRHHFC